MYFWGQNVTVFSRCVSVQPVRRDPMWHELGLLQDQRQQLRVQLLPWIFQQHV